MGKSFSQKPCHVYWCAVSIILVLKNSKSKLMANKQVNPSWFWRIARKRVFLIFLFSSLEMPRGAWRFIRCAPIYLYHEHRVHVRAWGATSFHSRLGCAPGANVLGIRSNSLIQISIPLECQFSLFLWINLSEYMKILTEVLLLMISLGDMASRDSYAIDGYR